MIGKRRKFYITKTTAVSVFFAAIFGTLLLRASGLESNGYGPRGQSLGFALVAVADDWTAIQYNPAGLAQVENSLFGAGYDLFTGGMHSTDSLRNLSPLLANPRKGDFIDPIGDEPTSFKVKTLGATIHSAALGYTRRYGQLAFGAGLNGSGSGTGWKDTARTSGGDKIDARFSFTNGALNVPLAVAWKYSNELFFGATAGFHYNMLDVENVKKRTGGIPYKSSFEQNTDGVSVGADIGALWKSRSGFSTGVVVKLPYVRRNDGKTTTDQSLIPLSASSNTTIDTFYPFRIAAGCSYRPDNRNLMALSVTWMNWKNYNQRTGYSNNVPGIFVDSSGNPSDWNNTVVAGLGWERSVADLWKMRLGLAYDQAPEPKAFRTLIGGQVVDTWEFGIGIGRRLGAGSIDFSYLLTYGPDVDGFIPGAKYGMTTHEFNVAYQLRF